MKKRTVVIIGAGGIVGTHIASMLSKKIEKVVLVDIEPLKEKLNAIARDIRTQYNLAGYTTDVIATTNYDEIEKLGQDDIVVITAGKARDPNDKNSTREALFAINKKIVNGIGKTLKEKVFKNGEQPLIIILTNPVDSILKSFIEANSFDPKKTVGSGNHLDSVRFKQNLADKLKVKDSDLKYVYVVGQHGKNMVYCVDKIKVCGIFLRNYMAKHNISEDIIQEACNLTTSEGSRIISAAGATCFGPAASVVNIINCFIGAKSELFSLSMMHDDGNCFGSPVYVSKDKLEITENCNLTNEECRKLKDSINSINELSASDSNNE